jgi:hypothetical protein
MLEMEPLYCPLLLLPAAKTPHNGHYTADPTRKDLKGNSGDFPGSFASCVPTGSGETGTLECPQVQTKPKNLKIEKQKLFHLNNKEKLY